ncbi:hypothetical protein HYC85_025414 [Camellia sinensis]|uniref:Mannan endo-1,4-beta-mannosidase n=1 Tax=Camellia sinensis TaxID=4442 RepID=A0A7J7GEP7_CAMSI|nr:hypothetical protein HYC85_025414 [Camellia sinensis]
MAFMQKWVENHWAGSGKIVRKPLVITEFGKSSKDPGLSVFTDIDNLARNGGTIGGSLVWQLMAQGMDPYFHGYQIILSEDPSTDVVISRQSHQMADLSHF